MSTGLVIESLGAGVQSTAMFVLSCLAKTDPDAAAALLTRYREGKRAPRFEQDPVDLEAANLARMDAAIFADTRWEPAHVMRHLEKLTAYGAEHDISVHLASRGSLPDDVLNPQVYATIPAWTLDDVHERVPVAWRVCPTCNGAQHLVSEPEELCADCEGQGSIPARFVTRLRGTAKGRIKRQCTPKYKIEVIQRQVRIMLGARGWYERCRYCDGSGQRVAPWEPERGVHECDVCRGSGQRRRVGSVPKGAMAEQWIGFSTDEVERASTSGFPGYQKPAFPLLDIRWSRTDCETFLNEQGWQAEKSACIGCPFHDDNVWIDMKRRDPDEFAKAVAFDESPAFRNGSGMAGARFLHESRIPLREAVEKAEASALARGEQSLLFGTTKRPQRRGCSPYGCRTVEYADESTEGIA